MGILSLYLFSKYFLFDKQHRTPQTDWTLFCYQPLKDRLDRCHFVGVTPKETPPAKAEQGVSLLNKLQERRIAFGMSKERDRSAIQVSVCIHKYNFTANKRVGFW